MDIGKIISDRRKELGLTFEQIGDYVGVTKSTVKKWEAGTISEMRRDKIAKLSKILKISPLLLVLEDEEYIPPFDISDREKQLIIAYRAHPEHQPTIDKVLELE